MLITSLFALVFTGNFEHVGNRRLRVLISLQLQRYVSTTSRFEKSNVIDLLVEQVREAAGPRGGFVKRDQNGVWFQMTKSLAREKVSHRFLFKRGKCLLS